MLNIKYIEMSDKIKLLLTLKFFRCCLTMPPSFNEAQIPYV